jgi:hypothetical protein
LPDAGRKVFVLHKAGGDGFSGDPAPSTPAAYRDVRKTLQRFTFNLLVGRHDWLVLEVFVSPRRVSLQTAQQVRWTGPYPSVLASEQVSDEEPDRKRKTRRLRARRPGLDAIERLEQRWDQRLPMPPSPHETQLRGAGFLLARRLFRPALAAVLLNGRRTGPDVALALSSESITTIVERMEGRCRPESLIAQLTTHFGGRSFRLMRTVPKQRATDPGERPQHGRSILRRAESLAHLRGEVSQELPD